MESLPLYISIVFMLTTFLTVLFFCKATPAPKPIAIILVAWLVLQALIAGTGFYTISNTMPPRFIVLVLPPLLLIIVLMLTGKGRQFIDSLDIQSLTILHIIRVPVELVLLWLFMYKAIPQVMTFEGRNLDILSGITAALLYYFTFVQKKLGPAVLLVWNFICLGLLVNIVVLAVLSAPFPFQRMAFDQPNIAVLYFPFIWLPGCVVPLVLLSHLAAIRQIILKKTAGLINH